MSITIFSLIMAILWFDAFILISSSIRRKTGVLLQYSLFPLLILSIISIVRVIIPLELPFTTVLRSHDWLPILQNILKYKFSIFNLQINIGWALVLISSTVSVILLINLFINMRKSTLSIRALYTEEDKRAKCILQDIIDETKSGKNFTIRIAPDIASPIVTGFFYPIILMPEGTQLLSDKQLKYVLRHEWCHYVSKDLWAKLFIHILCCIMWWNPPVHLLKKDFDQVLELNCDQRVTRRMTERERLEYLETILEILKQYHGKNNSFLIDVVGVNFIGIDKAENTTQRFQMVYDYKKNISTQKSNFIIAIIMSVLFFVSYSFVFQPFIPMPQDGLIITPKSAYLESAYLEPNETGGYTLFVNGEEIDSISKDDIQTDQYNSLPIIKNNKNRSEKS